MEDSLFLTLSSGLFMGQEQTNHNDFTTILYKPICRPLGFYEVGLCSITYKSKDTIFSGDLNNYWMRMVVDEEKVLSKYQLLKGNFDLERSLTNLNLGLIAEKPQNFLFGMRKRQGNLEVEIQVKTDSKIIRLPEVTRKLLGFIQTDFSKQGTNYTAPNPCDISLFNNYPIGHVFTIELVSPTKIDQKIIIPEPSNNSIEDFVTELNIVSRESTWPIRFISENKTIEIQFTQRDCKLEFSKEMQFILGLKQEFITENIKIPNIDFANEEFLVNVESNVIESQVYGSRVLPILKTFSPSTRDESGLVNLSFFPVQYVPLCLQEINSVNLKVTNQFFDPIRIDSEFGVTCVMHIRQKKNVV
jgi:hypothetical protein